MSNKVAMSVDLEFGIVGIQEISAAMNHPPEVHCYEIEQYIESFSLTIRDSLRSR